MFKYFLLLIITVVVFNTPSKAQSYEILSAIKNIQIPLKKANISHDAIKFKFKSNESKVLILIPNTQNKSGKAELIDYDLAQNKINNNWLFTAPLAFKRMRDFTVKDGSVLYIAGVYNGMKTHSALFEYTLNTNKITKRINTLGKTDFSKIKNLNDSLFLLYSLYDYHPADGKMKLQLFIYNSVKKKIIRSRTVAFEGISLANIVHQWVNVIDGKIFVVTPFTGRVSVFNSRLIKIKTFQLPLEELLSVENKKYITSLDSILRSDYITFEHYEAYHTDTATLFALRNGQIGLNFFSKKNIGFKIKKLRKNYVYVEKILPYNDSIAIMSIYRPKFKLEFRSLYFINIHNFHIVDSISKWRCMKPPKGSIMRNPEDYFTVDICCNLFFMTIKCTHILHIPCRNSKLG